MELRGLEPLTPTLPGRLDCVRGGSTKYVRRGQSIPRSSVTYQDDPGRRGLATIVAPFLRRRDTCAQVPLLRGNGGLPRVSVDDPLHESVEVDDAGASKATPFIVAMVT